VLPVATVGGHRVGEGLDEPDTVVTDHGEHERGHERIVTSRPALASASLCRLSRPPLGISARRSNPPSTAAASPRRRGRPPDRTDDPPPAPTRMTATANTVTAMSLSVGSEWSLVRAFRTDRRPCRRRALASALISAWAADTPGCFRPTFDSGGVPAFPDAALERYPRDSPMELHRVFRHGDDPLRSRIAGRRQPVFQPGNCTPKRHDRGVARVGMVSVGRSNVST
jgi:hypothetical protein